MIVPKGVPHYNVKSWKSRIISFSERNKDGCGYRRQRRTVSIRVQSTRLFQPSVRTLLYSCLCFSKSFAIRLPASRVGVQRDGSSLSVSDRLDPSIFLPCANALQSGIVIKFNNADQNTPLANRCTDSISRDTLSRKQFLIQYGLLRPNQTI